MPKKRQYRRRDSGSDSDNEKVDEDDEYGPSFSEDKRLRYALDDIRDLQKMRKRTAGLSTTDLAMPLPGGEIKFVSAQVADPLKLRSGGMITLKSIKSSDLRKYVEEQLLKKTGKVGEKREEEKKGGERSDDSLFALPEQLKKYQSKKNEEMLSNQMLCGIPEVELGIDAKIRNIEETETTKIRLLKEAVEKRKNLEEATTFRQDIVKDLAKDYVRHNRYDIDASTGFGRPDRSVKRPPTEAVAVVGEDTPSWMQDGKQVETPAHRKAPANPKPSDKHHYEKFKKKFIQDKK